MTCFRDCESTVTMHIRCRRWVILSIMTALVGLHGYSLLTYSSHHQELHSQSIAVEESLLSPIQHRTRRSHRKGKKQTKTNNKSRVNPESLAPNATVSACLLLKDDNRILTEWLAYHYHSIRLRHLVVAVDPSSETSPRQILEKWQKHSNLTVELWSDDDYMPKSFLESGRPPQDFIRGEDKTLRKKFSSIDPAVVRHRYRQRVFLARCYGHLRKLKKTWVVHIDTDEYIVPSKLLRQMNRTIVDPTEEGNVLKLVQNHAQTSLHYPCISMLRVLFGSRPISSGLTGHPPFENMETYTWTWHALPHNQSQQGNPKTWLDVSKIPHIPEMVFSIHRPLPQYCQRHTTLKFTQFRQQMVAVNHYLGSWERYQHRQDVRRSWETYQTKNQTASRGRDDGLTMWLPSFCKSVGMEQALILLEDHVQRLDA